MTIERQGATAFNEENGCPHCGESKKVRHREFSTQVWSFLVVNQEIDEENIGAAICDDCFSELREFLKDSILQVENFEAPEELTQKISAAKIRFRTQAATI